MRLGADDYIQKPFMNEHVLERLLRIGKFRALLSENQRLARAAAEQPRPGPARRDRPESRDAGGGQDRAHRRADRGLGVDRGRKWHRQGAHRARDPPAEPAQATSRSSRCRVERCPTPCSRPSCLATRRARSPTRSASAAVASRSPTAVQHLPRRHRRHADVGAGQAAARAAGARVRAGRRRDVGARSTSA
jgi:hypothetical protein